VSAPEAPRPDAPPPLRYEKRDVEPSAVVRFGAILAVFALVTTLALLPVFSWLRAREQRHDPPPPPMGRQPPGVRQAPEPRLQVSPPQELEMVQRQAERELQGYGWVDEEKGVVRIPIDEAMRLLVERSAAAAAAPAASPSPAAPPAAPAPAPGRRTR
jgi:hypothetical protein